jgi:hypothetical protein
MWTYPGSSCLDRPSPEELSVVEVEAQICKVLDSVVIQLHGAGPIPYEEGSPVLGSVP